MTTTLQMLQKSARLKVYEDLEIKRRYNGTYEAAWFSISAYLNATNATKISQKLDFESFGYGQFKTGSGTFNVDNSQGKFNDEIDLYSLWNNADSRHYTKIRYKAGYRDENSAKIDETVFEGLLNEKTIIPNYNTGDLTFVALAYESITNERTVAESVMTASMTAKEVIEEIMQDTTITDFITYSAGNINPGTNITFDNAIQFEKRKVADVLTDIAKKTNSVWYIDGSQNLIFRSRTVNVVTAFAFTGGSRQNRNCNILDDGIVQYDPGYSRIINQVKYTSGAVTYVRSAAADNLARYGTNELPLSGEDITSSATISALSDDIIGDNFLPLVTVVVRTYYMPNVIEFLDPATIDFRPKLASRLNISLLIFNSRTYFNNGYFFQKYINRLILTTDYSYKYYGFEHDVVAGYTDHFLVRQ